MRIKSLLGIIIVLFVIGSAIASGQALHVGPEPFSLRHATLPSIRIVVEPENDTPTLNFYPSPDLRGSPRMVVRREGLFLDQKALCNWTPGRDLEACPQNLPVSMKISDGGLGFPVLLIAVSGVKGTRGEVRFRGRPMYFDTKTLPDGWSWLKSQRTADRQVAAQLAKQLKDPAFAEFYHGTRSCLRGGTPTCLTKYLDRSFTFTPWWTSDGGTVSAKDFATSVWKASRGSHNSEWHEIAEVLLWGRFSLGYERVQFQVGWVYCDVARRHGKYVIVECGASD